VDAGIDLVQVRERDLEAAPLADLVGAMVALARGTNTRIVVNERLDVALICGAAGVHLRADSVPPDVVRRITPPEFLIGRSVHSAAEAAACGGADYLIAGTVWTSPSKTANHATIGLDGLAAIAAAARVPVLAIGGVTAERLAAAAGAGAAGVAGIGLFLASEPAADGCRAGALSAIVRRARRPFDTLKTPS
jgi:thiamine-phosphate pyrophosphorylase